MTEILERKKFLIKERMDMGRLQEVYDIFEPETGSPIGAAVETAFWWVKALKFFLDRDMLPFCIRISDSKGNVHISLCRCGGCWVPTTVKNADGKVIASFHKRQISLGGKIDIFDGEGHEMGAITGEWSGKKYLLSDSNGGLQGEIDHISSGLFKDHFTSVDDYEARLIGDQNFAPILLAAVITIDMLYHEG